MKNKYLTAGNWLNKFHKMEYYSTIKKNEDTSN